MHPLAGYARVKGWNAAELDAYAAELKQLYAQGLGSPAIGRRLGSAPRNVLRHLRALGVTIRPPGRQRVPRPPCRRCGEPTASPKHVYCAAHGPRRRRHPPAAPRVCELDGCDVVFTPPGYKAAHGAGRFCCYAHWNEWRGGKPQRDWKPKP